MANRKPIDLFGRSSERRSTKREWYEMDDDIVVACHHLEDKETSFRLIKKDGSKGWKYQVSRADADCSLDQFRLDNGIGINVDEDGNKSLDVTVLRKTEAYNSLRIFHFTTFRVIEAVIQKKAGSYAVTARLWNPGLDMEIRFTGGSGHSEQIAKDRIFNHFNRAYPGCTMLPEVPIID